MSIRERLRRWFFRRQQAESGLIELNRRRIYIVPTKTGALFALVLFLMYVGAVNYNLGLGHALVFLLVGLSLVAMLHTFRNLVGLRLRAGRIAPVFAGETARFEVMVENPRTELRPAISLAILDDDRPPGIPPDTISLAPTSRSAVELPVRALRRGTLQLGRLVVATRYPLGLFRAWSYPWPTAHCLIYPAPIYRPLPAPRASELTSGDQALQSENQDDFAGFRRHQPGDSPRHVAWKIYARGAADSPLLVKEFAGAGIVQHWFDWESTSSADDTETRLSTICGWVLQAQRDQLAFGMTLPGLTLPPGQGEHHAALALEALARFGVEQ